MKSDIARPDPLMFLHLSEEFIKGDIEKLRKLNYQFKNSIVGKN